MRLTTKLISCFVVFFAPIFLIKSMGLIVGYRMDPWSAMYFGNILGFVAMFGLAFALFIDD